MIGGRRRRRRRQRGGGVLRKLKAARDMARAAVNARASLTRAIGSLQGAKRQVQDRIGRVRRRLGGR